jgi:glycosyltransferase involved in cell wall biosynthesis
VRILHAPQNIAGQASTIAEAQKELGHQSSVWVYAQNYLEYPCDLNLDINRKRFPQREIAEVRALLKAITRFDVFHFHFGESFLPYYLDVPLLRLFGKKVFMHYWGGDILQRDIALKETLFDEETLSRTIPKGVTDEKRRRRIRWANRLMNRTIVGDYSLLPYSPESVVVRQAMKVSSIKYYGCDLNKRPTIVHAPTNRRVKGTKYVLEAVELLRGEGFDFEFILVENTPHEEALTILSKGDIVIDDVRQGPYGILAMEGMAMGKVVMARINPRLMQYYEGLPIVNTSPENIAENLRWLLRNPEARMDLGRRGREYVENNHDAIVIAKKLLEIYAAN